MRVFAVEDTSAQICWRAADSSGAPGATTVTGLDPGRAQEVQVEVAGGPSGRVTVTTLVAPPGAERSRIATMNDLHLGERSFGFFRRMRERGAVEPYPVRCARAALAEALAWGAQMIVLKGDITDAARSSQWDQMAEIFGGCPVPVVGVRGNHDVVRRGADGRRQLERAGIAMAEEPTAHDLPGLRIVLAQSAVAGRGDGRIDAAQRERVAVLVAAAEGGALVALHHQAQRFRVHTYHPPGIPGPMARRFLDSIAEANPATVVASGHTHRHRRRNRGPLVLSEVGSTKDYPGTWTGYVAHDGGIRQVVRRVAAPDAIAWTERTRGAVGGVWGLWSPGTLADRCWSHPWPTPN